MEHHTSVKTKPRYRRVVRDGYAALLLDGRKVHECWPAETTLDELIAEYEGDRYDRAHRLGYYEEAAR